MLPLLVLCVSAALLGAYTIAFQRATLHWGRVLAPENELLPTGLRAADRRLADIHTENPIRATIASTYLREMRDSIQEVWQQLKVGGYFVLVAANNQICGREFKTQHYLRLIAEEIGFRTILRLIDDIRSRGLMTKRNKTASVITREWVFVFVKDKKG